MARLSVVLSVFLSVISVIASASPPPSPQDLYLSSNEADQLLKRTSSPWWFANIPRNGSVAYQGNSGYTLFRNVKDFGAVGDGVTDDIIAINASMFLGPRCLGQFFASGPCESSTITPAIIYFPPGKYLISQRVILPYNTIVIGDALDMPTIIGAPGFSGIALFDSDPYYPGGANWYANQNNFFRQVRNFIFDITQLPLGFGACIHWQVAQATSLQNLVFNMRTGGGSANLQQGIFMENGSGGFMRDLIFNGGGIGFFLGNQQFTSTNLTFNNCLTAIKINFIWIWSFRDITFNDCDVGIDMWQQTGYQDNGEANGAIGAMTLADSKFNNVGVGIISEFNFTHQPPASGQFLLDNVDFTGATTAIAHQNGTVILEGGTLVDGWAQGPFYSTSYSTQTFPDHDNDVCWVPNSQSSCYQGSYTHPTRPSGLFDLNRAKIFDRGKPSYDSWIVGDFVSAKHSGCAGDGVTDDTACLQNLFNSVTWSQVAYIDHGAYVITEPIVIPKNIRIMGEGWPLIMIKSSPVWSHQANPQPAIIVGQKGDVGKLEMQDIIFETLGPVPGAILMEWNLEEDGQGTAGMWDVHWRIGGSAGTSLEVNTCQKNPSVFITVPNSLCYGAYMLIHITSSASLYMENNWGWVSDHELDANPHDQINIWNGRGILVESVKPFWLVGSSFEHSQLYNYGIHNAQQVYMSHIQSETAYMQSNPSATLAFAPNATWQDPDFAICMGASECVKTYGLHVWNSSYVYIYSAGLYSFFENYDSTYCLPQVNCQTNAASIQASGQVYLYNLYTVGTANMVLMDNQQLALHEASLNNNTFGQSLVVFGYPETGPI